MLVLDLGVEDEVVVELVAEVEDGAGEVDRVREAGRRSVLFRRSEALIEDLAVPADRDAFPGVDACRCRPEAEVRRGLFGRGNRSRTGGAAAAPGTVEAGDSPMRRALDFLREDVDLPLEILQALLAILLGLRGGFVGKGGERKKKTA